MFEQKSKQLTVIFLVLGLTLASQAQVYVNWVGTIADANGLGYWDEPRNWDSGAVPTAAEWAVIGEPNATVVVDDYYPGVKEVADISMGQGPSDVNVTLLITTAEGGSGEGGSLKASRLSMASYGGKNCLLQMDAGKLNIGDLRTCSTGSNLPDATIIINGGVANIASLSLTEAAEESYATLIMNGGELNISSKLTVGKPPAVARIELNGGIAKISRLLPTASLSIDITEGLLVLDGDQTIQINGLATTGQLTVAGKDPIRGGLSVVYDAQTRKTTVTGDLSLLDVNKAWNPTPKPSAIDLPVDTPLLSWSAGDATAATGGHDVYLGTDPNTVKNDSTDNAMGTYQYRIDVNELAMPADLILGQTYYWRIDQVASDGTIYKGDLWSFSVVDSLPVDDFETYDDVEPNEIFATWKDGVDVADNGMQVGNWYAPYAEQTIVKQGAQSMPLFYDNSNGVVNSEAKRTFEEAWNWSKNGIKSLSVLFRGEPDNTFDTVYVKINDTKVPYPLSTKHLKFARWQSWIINLNDVQTDLSNVTSLSIGVDGAGSGTFYIDNISVYPRESEMLSAGVEPDNTKLLAHYPLNGNAQDISGNGRHGTVTGTPNWVDGALDGALDMRGTRGINCGEFDPTGGTGTFTMTTWCYWDGAEGVQHLLTKQNGWGTNSMMFQIEIKGYESWVSPLELNKLHIAYANAPQARFFEVPAHEWSHITLVFDGTHATAYLNGVDLNGPQATGIGNYVMTPVFIGAENSGSRLLKGMLDDFRLYSYPLTPEEALGTIEVDLGFKPF